MKCDHCDKSATVRETTVRNGAKIERNLCESCAIQLGVLPEPTGGPPQAASPSGPVFISVQGAGRAAICPTCSTSHTEFKQSGLLGCADCYKVFEAQLGPLLERVQEGGVVHRGKRPKHLPPDSPESADAAESPAKPPRKRAEKPQPLNLAIITQLSAKLDAAVREERYEEAARLRDQLAKLKAAIAAANKPCKPDEQEETA